MIDHPSVYDFCGARLAVESEDLSLAALFDVGFKPFRLAETLIHEDAFRLRIVVGEPIFPSGMPLVWSGALPEGGAAWLFEEDARCVLVVENACSLDVDLGTGAATLVVTSSGMRRFMGSPSMMLLDVALRPSRQRLLHAACLVDPGSGGAFLIFGASGRGKTSTAIALARGGFPLMTDDASILGETEGGLHAWGMPRDLKVHRHTAELIPWIASLLGKTWDMSGEQPVRLAAIDGHVAIAALASRPLAAIVILGERMDGRHRLGRFDKREALLAIAADNVPSYPTGVPCHARETFAALARAVAAVPTFQLNAGRDLASLPALFAKSLPGAGSDAEQGR